MSTYMGGARGSGVLAREGDVLEMNVVRGVGGVRDMCMCLARGGVGGVGGEWMTGLGLGFTNSGGYVSVFWLRWCGCVGESGWAVWAREGGVVLCMCVVSLDSLC